MAEPAGHMTTSFAKAVFRKIHNLAFRLACKEELASLFIIAARLRFVVDEVDTQGYVNIDFEKALSLLESACNHTINVDHTVQRVFQWPDNPESRRLSILHALVDESDEYKRRVLPDRQSNLVEQEVAEGLVRCAKQFDSPDRQRKRGIPTHTEGNPLEQLLDVLPRLDVIEFVNPHHNQIQEDETECPLTASTLLHRTLQRQLDCRCTFRLRFLRKHSTRLCFKPRVVLEEDNVLFDTLICGHPPQLSHTAHVWQQIRFLVPVGSSHDTNVIEISFEGHDPHPEPSNQIAASQPHGEFCKIINEDHGPVVIIFATTQQGLVHHVDEDLSESVVPCGSLSLTQVLLEYRMSARTKITLAYILAQSVWQFYDSDWMNTRWSTDTVHLVKRRLATDTATEELPYACEPCLEVTFSNDRQKVPEHYTDGIFAHRYPRLLALGNLLIAISHPSPEHLMKAHVPQTEEQQINSDYAAANLLFKNSEWPALQPLRDLPGRNPVQIYRDIVKRCFDRHLFSQRSRSAFGPSAADLAEKSDNSVARRRSIIYAQVVVPLKNLLDNIGWTAVLTESQPLERRPNEDQQLASYRPQSEVVGTAYGLRRISHSADSPGQLSARWIECTRHAYGQAIRAVPVDYRLRFRYQRIRVAVIDTGYDPQAEFFQNRDRRKCFKGWKDFVAQSGQGQDSDGHGSKVLSLVMKMAPIADIYVARVTNTSEGLKQSSLAIAQAIRWAAQECRVDIVSISFGFSNEELVNGESVVSNAISEAIHERQEKILFFGAAGNEGANNSKPAFPARHHHFIPVYGTSANGVFLDFLNPRIGLHDAAIYGTLAENIQCSGRKGDRISNVTGTSFSTAIMAGMAASILEYVQVLRTTNYTTSFSGSVLSTKRGILELFRTMFTPPADRRYYIEISQWFQKSEDVRRADIIRAVHNLE